MATPSPAKRLAALLLPILLSRADPNAPCYFPSSGPAALAPGFFPCIPYNAPVGACCPAGWTCYSNALCIATTPSTYFPNQTYGAFRRAACTNPKWDNSACGSFCLGKPSLPPLPLHRNILKPLQRRRRHQRRTHRLHSLLPPRRRRPGLRHLLLQSRL